MFTLENPEPEDVLYFGFENDWNDELLLLNGVTVSILI